MFKLFVWNIEWGVSEDELRDLFWKYWEIEEAIIIKDRLTWRSKGFGFVTFSSSEWLEQSIKELNWYELNWRTLVVNKARARS